MILGTRGKDNIVAMAVFEVLTKTFPANHAIRRNTDLIRDGSCSIPSNSNTRKIQRTISRIDGLC